MYFLDFAYQFDKHKSFTIIEIFVENYVLQNYFFVYYAIKISEHFLADLYNRARLIIFFEFNFFIISREFWNYYLYSNFISSCHYQ